MRSNDWIDREIAERVGVSRDKVTEWVITGALRGEARNGVLRLPVTELMVAKNLVAGMTPQEARKQMRQDLVAGRERPDLEDSID